MLHNDCLVSNTYSSYFFYYSIMPATLIEPHKDLSPLPKQLPAVQMSVKTKDLTKRLSDVSSLSAGSSGYQANTSSIGTASSSSSQRDRLRYFQLIFMHLRFHEIFLKLVIKFCYLSNFFLFQYYARDFDRTPQCFISITKKTSCCPDVGEDQRFSKKAVRCQLFEQRLQWIPD